jgi:hypothetical protein
MNEILLPDQDARLSNRLEILIQEHMGHGHKVAAGPRVLPGPNSAFAATQAAWRFYNNDALTLPSLVQPLLTQARVAAKECCQHFALVMHDWSFLGYSTHTGKKGRIELSNSSEIGYELRSGLLVSDQGEPLAPLCQDLRAEDGVYSTCHEKVQPSDSCLDELEPVFSYVHELQLGVPVVHIIDREADSVGHYRQWQEAKHLFLIRADDIRLVRHEGIERKLPEVVALLASRQAFQDTREVLWHGKPARQHIAETEVILDRPAKPHRVGPDGVKKRVTVPGPAITLRLVVSRVFDDQGELLAQWLLLTNLPATVTAAVIALWYYWRWRIESFFKLLKGAGQQLEQWQQETPIAIARRLCVASMACVLIWQLTRSQTPQASRLRRLLIRLSGRQMKKGTEFTAPALLAGMWVLLAMLEVLDQHEVPELRELADYAMAGAFNTG